MRKVYVTIIAIIASFGLKGQIVEVVNDTLLIVTFKSKYKSKILVVNDYTVYEFADRNAKLLLCDELILNYFVDSSVVFEGSLNSIQNVFKNSIFHKVKIKDNEGTFKSKYQYISIVATYAYSNCTGAKNYNLIGISDYTLLSHYDNVKVKDAFYIGVRYYMKYSIFGI